MFTQRTLIAASLASLLLGAGAATLLRPAEQAHDHGATPAASGDAATQYTCPMHPSVLSDRPTVCPICNMDLVPKKAGAGDALDSQQLAAAGRVSLSATQRVLANVQTVDARQGTLKRELRAVGLATYDETGLSTVPSWVAGRVDKLYIKETGKQVTRGQRLMTLYSPTLLAAQEELLALSAGDDQAREARAPLIQAARRRLELLGMSKGQIEDVLRRREASAQVHISATSSGTITEIMVRQGQYVEMGMPLLALADLRDVWIEAQIYEHQRAYIKEGMSARVVSSAYPGESFVGRVTLIKPVVRESARTTPVRIELDGDASKRFKPGMYTTVYLDQSAAEEGVIVPLDAIIRTGRHDYVYVEVEEDLFERREVMVRGVEEGQAQLEAGAVKPGERVAATGGFLIDSELQLRAPLEGVHAHHDHAPASGLVTLTAEGTRFNPPIKPEQLPDGAWYCDMGTVEYARMDKGDGECPVCGMKLKHKAGDHKK